MIKRVVGLLAILALGLSLSIPVSAAESGEGVVAGQLVNGTTGGGSVANQEVTLTTFLKDTEKGSATAKTDSEGRFVFKGLVTNPDYGYEAKLNFQEADYNSERLIFQEGELTKTVEITIYDATSSDEAIKLNTVHTVVYIEEGNLHVEEYYLFVNEADRTYVGSGEITATGKRRTLKLPLPNKTSGIEYGGELMVCCVLPGDGDLFDTMAILPGEKWVSYSYEVKYGSGDYTFSRGVNYPTANYNLLVQGENTKVTSNLLTAQQPVTLEGVQYSYLTGSNLVQGDSLSIQLAGLPANIQTTAIWVTAITLMVLTSGFGLGYLMRRKKAQPVVSSDNLEQRRQRLLAEIARLDDDFEDGKILEEVYRRSRARSKSQLLALTQRGKR